MAAVRRWREDGDAACFTIDAGPNVHVLCPAEQADGIERNLATLGGVQRVLRASPGGPAHLVSRT
jgi:diphosphomevalonate decarboxylase